MSKPSIFKDPKIQSKFEEEGYVVIDFISEAEVNIIAKKFYDTHAEIPSGFFATAYNPNDDVKKTIFDHTDNVFENALNSVFHDYKKLGSTFLCKAPGEDSKVRVHQDWYVVDEEKYYSATIWVPMHDTTEENGTLRVLPGSHLYFDAYRSPNIPVPYRGNEQLIWDSMISVPLKTGQAFVLNHAVIHASAPNLTNKERLVVAYGVIPKEADLMFYHQNENGRVEKMVVPDDFFQRYYNIGQKPLVGETVEEFEYQVPQKSTNELTVLIEASRKKHHFVSQPSTPAKQTKSKTLTISIPAYNDSLSLTKLVDESHQVCNKLRIPFELFIVNDGSSDNTLAVAQQLAEKYKNITILNHEKNLGFGPTLRDVFVTPKTEWVLFLPGDNQFPASNLETLLQYRDQYDFILGKRKIRKDNFIRLMYAGFYNWLVSFLSGHPVDDVNGIAFYRTSILEKIKFTAKTSFIHAEFFIEAHNKGFRVIEIPIEHKEREFGKGAGGKWTVIVPIVLELFSYIRKNKQDGYRN
jgi:ectoine hydroxylase-related dioxygenase (phytanoyl-CoA dioxygenase family)